VVDTALDLARWFNRSGGAAAGRMARHTAELPAALTGDARPAPGRILTETGAYGVPFGRMEADNLAALLRTSGADAVRVTPWRRIVLEGAEPVSIDGFVVPTDGALRTDACVGAPACPQATVETRALALALAPHVKGSLHVSGCGKGCARPAPADIVLTGRQGAFDLAFNARAGGEPAHAGLDHAQILALLGSD
jgi:precorrin-3B synthase